jgi:hypothetical protein
LESFNLVFVLPDFLHVVFNVPPALVLFPPQVLSFSLQVGSFSFCFLGGPDDLRVSFLHQSEFFFCSFLF